MSNKKYRLLSVLAFFCLVVFSAPAIELIYGDTSKHVTAKKIEKELHIDGVLDEPEWLDAPLLGGLTQVEPVEGAEPSRKTEVKLLYNGDYLYIGVICYEDNIDDIISYQMVRDGDPESEDRVQFVLDTFLDHRNGYMFMVTPAGSKTDGVIIITYENLDTSWDGIWFAETSINQNGWIAEIAIPFKTLSFNPDLDTWGFNLSRFIKRNEELARWANPYQDASTLNMTLAGELHGLHNLDQGLGLDIKPFAKVKINHEYAAETETTPDSGFDIFYNITANLKASFTFNTDFAETEVDSRQINLTRFPILYPEKRDFFLEGAGMFNIAKMNEDVIPFFSRRIGLLYAEEVPIDWGLKATGRVGNYNIGLLDVQTGNRNGLDSQNLLALRVTRNILQESYIGMIFTNGNPSGKGYNRMYGGDFHFGTSKLFGDKNFYIDGNYLMTDDENLPGKDNQCWKISIDYPNDQLDTGVQFLEVGENFNPALGFVRRTGIRMLTSFLSYMPRPDIDFIRKFQFAAYGDWFWDFEGRLLEYNFELIPLGISFESGDWAEIEIEFTYDLLDEPFEISEGIVISPGEYSNTVYAIRAESSVKRIISAFVSFETGSYYGGNIDQFEAYVNIKPNKHFNFELMTEYNNVELPAGDFEAKIYGAEINVLFNPELSWKNIIQYDNFSDVLGIFSRLHWIIEEGNDLYIVLQRNWVKEEDELLPYNWRFDVKINYTLRL